MITPDDYILKDLSFHKDVKNEEFAWIMSAVKLPRAVQVGGNLTVIGEAFASSYYHWLFHALGRLCYVKKRFPFDQISYFAVSHQTNDFHRATLEMMGVPKEKLLLLKDFPHIAPDAVVMSNWTGRFDPNVAVMLREALLPHLPPQVSGPKRIYVSRARCPSRHLDNEAELLEILEPLGFQTVICEENSLAQNMSLFDGAEAIFAPHGAGLSNIVFCKPGTKVIELFNQDWHPEVFWQLSEAIGLSHYCLLGQNSTVPRKGAKGPQHENIHLDPKALKKMLKLAGLS